VTEKERVRLVDLADIQSSMSDISPEAWAALRRRAQEVAMENVPREHLGRYRDAEAKKLVRYQVLHVVESERPGLPYQAKTAIVDKLTDEISGYGPLEKLLDDKDVTEVIVESFDMIVIEKDGVLEETGVRFDSEEHLRLVIERIISPLGRRLDWSSPIVDARLPDGSRICAVIPPVSPGGAQLTVRKFKSNLTMKELIELETIDERLKAALESCVRARLSIVVSGGTGSGKSTFLNALSAYVHKSLSIITIENPIELQLDHPRVRSWEARPPNIEGRGEIDMLSLVIAALRSRPDIIIVGEVRGKEAFALMQALNTGHDGSMTTLHANSAQESTQRLISMVTAAGQLAGDLVPSFIASGMDIIVHLSRMPDGSRKVVGISEVLGEKDRKIIINDLVTYRVDKFDGQKVYGHWERTDNKFHRRERFEMMGIDFPGWLGEEE